MYDPYAIELLHGVGEPTVEARFRAEYFELKKHDRKPAGNTALDQIEQHDPLLIARLWARVGHFGPLG